MEPTAVIFSEPNFLADRFSVELQKKGCKVFLKQKEVDLLPERVDYCFLIPGAGVDVQKAFDFIKEKDPKSIVILPYVTNQKTEKISSETLEFFLKNDSPNLTLIYAGEPYGAGMNLEEKGFIANTFSGLAIGKVSVPNYDFISFPVYIDSLVEYLIRGIFSYGFEKRRFVLADKISSYDFIRRIQKVAPWISFERNSSFKKPTTVPVFDFISLGITDESIINTINWTKVLAEGLKPKPVPVKIKPRKKIRLKKPKIFRRRVFAVSLIILLWILSIPFFSLFASGITFERAYKSFVASDSNSAKNLLNVSGFFAGFAKGEFGELSKVPLLGRGFSFPYNAGSVLQDLVLLGKSGLGVYDDLSNMLKGIVSDKDYNLSLSSEKIFLTLDTMYKDSSFLETEIHGLGSLAINVFPQIKNFSTFRKYVLAASNLAQRLPVLLGNDKKRTYMVLFQNNMELRPTGGFIGSFALVTLDHGKLVDTSVYDVYEADGQLKGHVEPPTPIKNYLGEANWWLRDSNWDPDFRTSAQRAEWFLGKEFDREVDGVVAVDLEVVKAILAETGPVNLTDSNMVIDSKNMYEKIQHEVESNFFPGSQKKSTILTSLENALLVKLPDLVSKPKLGVSLLSLFKEKHIQVFLHDKDSQNVIESVDFDGRTDPGACSGNCLNVWFGMIEANLGVNKVNYYIKRDAKITISVRPTNVESQLSVKITNTLPTSSSFSGNYKNYMRVLAPSKSYFDKVTTMGADGTKTIQPDVVQVSGHVEAGVLVTIAQGETKTVVFSWNTAQSGDFSKDGEVDFYVRKQAGVDAMPLSLTMTLPIGKKYTVEPSAGFVLTGPYKVSYNTDLGTDITSRISWK